MMQKTRLLYLVALVCSFIYAPLPSAALDLPAGAKLQAKEVLDNERANFGIARHNGVDVPTIAAEGQVQRQAWKVSGTSQTSFQILVGIRDQLTADGYDLLFQCQSVSCGGYDFRFEIGHFRAPDIFIDLGDFHYLSAKKGDSFTAVFVSKSDDAAYVELTQVTPTGSTASAVSAQSGASVSTTTSTEPTGPLAAQLETSGRIVLGGLSFATGSSQLTTEDVPVLAELAAYLSSNPERKIILVGHTDAEGSLDGNIALSRKRATAVATSLIKLYGVNPAQLASQGVGYLMPLAANLTPEGRELNRRVEAVLTSTN